MWRAGFNCSPSISMGEGLPAVHTNTLPSVLTLGDRWFTLPSCAHPGGQVVHNTNRNNKVLNKFITLNSDSCSNYPLLSIARRVFGEPSVIPLLYTQETQVERREITCSKPLN